MNVVGHDDEAPSKPVVAGWAIEEECNEALECGLIVQDSRAAIHAQGQKIGNISVAIRPDTMQAAKTARVRFVRCENGEAVCGRTAYRVGGVHVVGRLPPTGVVSGGGRRVSPREGTRPTGWVVFML